MKIIYSFFGLIEQNHKLKLILICLFSLFIFLSIKYIYHIDKHEEQCISKENDLDQLITLYFDDKLEFLSEWRKNYDSCHDIYDSCNIWIIPKIDINEFNKSLIEYVINTPLNNYSEHKYHLNIKGFLNSIHGNKLNDKKITKKTLKENIILIDTSFTFNIYNNDSFIINNNKLNVNYISSNYMGSIYRYEDIDIFSIQYPHTDTTEFSYCEK